MAVARRRDPCHTHQRRMSGHGAQAFILTEFPGDSLVHPRWTTTDLEEVALVKKINK